MTFCTNSKCLHPIESHTILPENKTVLYCHHKWLLIGPKGEYWKWLECHETCDSDFKGFDGERRVTVSDVKPVPIFKTSAEPFKVYRIIIAGKLNSGYGVYECLFSHCGNESKKISVSLETSKLNTKEYVDVIDKDTEITTQFVGVGDAVLMSKVEKVS